LGLRDLLRLLLRETTSAQHLQRVDAEYQPQNTQDDDGPDPDAAATAPAHGDTKPATAATLAPAVFHIGTCLFIIQPHGLNSFIALTIPFPAVSPQRDRNIKT
jgi:hypothetical protein